MTSRRSRSLTACWLIPTRSPNAVCVMVPVRSTIQPPNKSFRSRTRPGRAMPVRPKAPGGTHCPNNGHGRPSMLRRGHRLRHRSSELRIEMGGDHQLGARTIVQMLGHFRRIGESDQQLQLARRVVAATEAGLATDLIEHANVRPLPHAVDDLALLRLYGTDKDIAMPLQARQ